MLADACPTRRDIPLLFNPTGSTLQTSRAFLLSLSSAIALLCTFSLTRVTLLATTAAVRDMPSLWPALLIKGLWFDLVVRLVLVAPFCLYAALVPEHWRRRRSVIAVVMVGCVFALASTALIAVAEVMFWLEFSTRFNFIAVDYLIYTHEVLANLWESYPMGAILGAIGLAALLVTALGARQIARAASAPTSTRQRLFLAAAGLLLPAAALYAADIDQMEGSGNAYADELSGNGLFTFAAAMRRNELDYMRFYATMPQERADEILRELQVERPPLVEPAAPDPSEDEGPLKRRPRNVVLVSVESLSAEFVGAYGSTLGLTPNLDALAAQGVRIDQLFATGTRTVRGLEALSLGTPPIPGQAIVRRPRNAHLATLGEVLGAQGMSPYFFYGGYGYFDNMNAYFASNAYRVVDRTDIPGSDVVFENAWGVADEVLFDHALRVLDDSDRAGRPFFAHILTTSNHRPYTYPQGRIDIPSPGGRNGAVKYTDYAIGKFIRDAHTRPWFDDTLFVLVADHCASVAGKTRLPVGSYRIPGILYAPALLAPGVHAGVTSQIDLAPTIVAILGKNGDNQFFGRSIYKADGAAHRAFISNYQELGYLRDGLLTVLRPKRVIESYRIDPQTLDAMPAEIESRPRDEAIAYYQSASQAFRAGALKFRTHVR